MKQLANMTKTTLYSVLALGLVCGSGPAFAQAPPAPAPAQAPAEPPAPTFTALGENYHVEFQAGAMMTVPSTAMFADTEDVTTTTNGTSTTTTVTGTNLDFKSLLGLQNTTVPEVHVTIRLVGKHKVRGEFIPLYYKQTVSSLASNFNFNGQTYLAGQTVESTLRWSMWNFAYEFDPIVTDRSYVGVVVAVSSLNVGGATANTAQSGTASVSILMPGLGGTGRYYVSSKLSITGDLLVFDLPGGSASTHGRMIEAGGYAMYSVTKHIGVQAGFRLLDETHGWSSPVNTGQMTVGGPFIGGTAHF